jgi:uncharacterized protein
MTFLRVLKFFFTFVAFNWCISVYAQDDFFLRLANAGSELTKQKVKYDPAYFSIPYPNGDVPEDRGVCTDVIIRAYRKLGVDLQQLVHEDMRSHFDLYPKNWGLKKTDKNIDHRRVPNLMKFFSRHGKTLPITNDEAIFKPGDIVTWDLGNGVTHIGLVVNERSADNKRNIVIHNIGNGQELSDCLFAYKITGHYRYSKNE